MAVGLSVGMIPLFGMHGVMVLAVCMPLRLDSPLAFAATMISNPVTFPLLVAAELKVGETLLGNAPVSLEKLMAGEGWWDAIWQLAVGTTVLSLTVGLLGASMAWGTTVAWRRWKRQKLHG